MRKPWLKEVIYQTSNRLLVVKKDSNSWPCDQKPILLMATLYAVVPDISLVLSTSLQTARNPLTAVLLSGGCINWYFSGWNLWNAGKHLRL